MMFIVAFLLTFSVGHASVSGTPASGKLDSCSGSGEKVDLKGNGDECTISSASSHCVVSVTNCEKLKVSSLSSHAKIQIEDDMLKEFTFDSLSSYALVELKAGTTIINSDGSCTSGAQIKQDGKVIVDMTPYTYQYDGGPKLKYCRDGQIQLMNGTDGECMVGDVSSGCILTVQKCVTLHVQSASSDGQIIMLDDELKTFSYSSLSSNAQVHLNEGVEVKDGSKSSGAKIVFSDSSTRAKYVLKVSIASLKGITGNGEGGRKKGGLLPLLLFLIVIVGVCCGGYFFFKSRSNPMMPPTKATLMEEGRSIEMASK